MEADVIRGRSLRKFDLDAPQYEQTSDGRFCARVYPAILKEIHAAPFSSLLDVGCGTGAILLKISGEKTLCGIDLSGRMIERARETLMESADLRVGDAGALPWPAASFDTVSCTFSFHHYPDPEQVLSEMNRVLKPGGRLILADPYLPGLLQPILNYAMQFSESGDCHTYSRREIKTFLVKNGFTLFSFRHPTHDSFLLTARKAGDTENA